MIIFIIINYFKYPKQQLIVLNTKYFDLYRNQQKDESGSHSQFVSDGADSILVFFLCLQDASLSYDPETPLGDVQSDVVFREGQTLGGHVTHTPRLIAMDLKGNFSNTCVYRC